jgi:hypothetical protein
MFEQLVHIGRCGGGEGCLKSVGVSRFALILSVFLDVLLVNKW